MTAYAMHRFDWASPPLTANQRLHWARKARLTSDVRSAAYLAFLAKWADNGEYGRVEVNLTWFVKDKRRRDVDNIVPTLKALCDGLVDAGIVPDDTPEYMVKRMPEIRFDPTEPAHFLLEVREIL